MSARHFIIGTFAILASGLAVQAAHAQSPLTNPGPNAGQIVGSPAAPARDLYTVHFIEIDGRNILPRNVLWIEPGKYTITVSAQIRNPRRRSTTGHSNLLEDDGLNEIELVVEAGKTYHIAALFDGEDRRRPYSTVVHRVEERE